MNDEKKEVKKVGILGIIANLFLLIIKFLGGIMFKSQALIADAVNSFGDVFSSAITLIGGKIAEKPEDEDHEFGHGKAEYVASFLIGIFMIIVAIDTLYSSILSIIQNKQFEVSYLLAAIPVVTIIVKTILYIYVKRVGNKKHSLLISANADDHRNDVLISTGVLIGIVFGYYGYYFIDGIVGSIISIVIVITGIKIARKAYDILIDKCIDSNISEEVKEQITQFEGVNHIDTIKSKPTGDKHMLIVKISVDPNMTVSESHKIAGKIREKLRQNEKIYDTVVHINPDE